jgi:hypothetical protein
MQAAQMLGGYSAGRRRPAAPRHGQEEGRGDGQAPGHLPRRARRARASPRKGRRGLRPDGEVRGLRLQQEPCRRLLAAGLPHGLDQGALHGRVLRREHDHRVGQHRQAEGAARRRQAVRHRFEAPDVNRGTYRFEPVRRNGCGYGLGAVKGTGRARSRPSWRARRTGAHEVPAGPSAAFDFCARVDRKAVNKRAVEALIKAGAFDACMPTAPACWPAWPGLRVGRHAGGQRQQGGLFDLGDHGSQHAGAGAGARAALDVRSVWCRRRRRWASSCRATCSTSERDEVRRFCRAASPTWSTAASRSCWPAS